MEFSEIGIHNKTEMSREDIQAHKTGQRDQHVVHIDLLTVEEIEAAEREIVTAVQTERYSEEMYDITRTEFPGDDGHVRSVIRSSLLKRPVDKLILLDQVGQLETQ